MVDYRYNPEEEARLSIEVSERIHRDLEQRHERLTDWYINALASIDRRDDFGFFRGALNVALIVTGIWTFVAFALWAAEKLT